MDETRIVTCGNSLNTGKLIRLNRRYTNIYYQYGSLN